MEDAADLFAHDGFHGCLFHADDGHVVFFGEGVANFHADKGAADDDNLLVLLLANSLQDGLHISHETEQKDVAQLLEPRQGKRPWDTSGCKNQLGIRDCLATFCGNGFILEVDRDHLVRDGLDSSLLIPVTRTPEEFFSIRNQSLGQLGPVDDEVWFPGDDSNGTFIVQFTNSLDQTKGTTPAAIVNIWYNTTMDAGLPPDNDNIPGLGCRTLQDRIPLTSPNSALVTLDINRTILFKNIEFIQGIRSRSILDISTPDIKTS